MADPLALRFSRGCAMSPQKDPIPPLH